MIFPFSPPSFGVWETAASAVQAPPFLFLAATAAALIGVAFPNFGGGYIPGKEIKEGLARLLKGLLLCMRGRFKRRHYF